MDRTFYYLAWLEAGAYCVDAWGSRYGRDAAARRFKAAGLTVLDAFDD
jgi:hypothetical protein